MITKRMYNDNSKELHRPFYAQFVTPQLRKHVIETIGLERMQQSQDQHFNDIPIKEWDDLNVVRLFDNKLWQMAHERRVDYRYPISMADCVCIAKSVAFEIRNAGHGTQESDGDYD